MPSRDDNLRVWDREYAWERDGDEWDDAAAACGVPYAEWKRELVARFLGGADGRAVLEIAPGHGRWSEILAARAAQLVLVDMSAACIEFCRRRLARHATVEYRVNDGRSLPGVADGSIDFVWSFDSFVHIEEEETAAYLGEIARVLAPGGGGWIHHPGEPLLEQPGGWRSAMTRARFRDLALAAGLTVAEQVDSWGAGERCNVRLFRDCLTRLARP